MNRREAFKKWLVEEYFYQKGNVLMKFKESSADDYLRYIEQASSDFSHNTTEIWLKATRGIMSKLSLAIAACGEFQNRPDKEQTNIKSALQAFEKYMSATSTC